MENLKYVGLDQIIFELFSKLKSVTGENKALINFIYSMLPCGLN